MADVRPFVGRFFEDREYRTAPPAVVVLDHDLWQRRLHGASNVIGTVLTVNDQPVTVIGVAEPGSLVQQPPKCGCRRSNGEIADVLVTSRQ